MIRHLCKIVWNRRRSSGLTALQIFISFVLLFVTLSLALDKSANYLRPLGYSCEDRWVVDFHRDRLTQADEPAAAVSRDQVYLALQGFDWVESVASAEYAALPFAFASRPSSRWTAASSPTAPSRTSSTALSGSSWSAAGGSARRTRPWTGSRSSSPAPSPRPSSAARTPSASGSRSGRASTDGSSGWSPTTAAAASCPPPVSTSSSGWTRSIRLASWSRCAPAPPWRPRSRSTGGCGPWRRATAWGSPPWRTTAPRPSS